MRLPSFSALAAVAVGYFSAAGIEPHGAAEIVLADATRPEKRAQNSAPAQNRQFESYPREVRSVLERARRDCRAAGGARLELQREIVRKIELTGDGRDDYIINFEHAECVDRGFMFHGTGGRDFIILVAKATSGFVRVFDGRIWSYEISDGPGPRTVRFHLHRGFCDKPDADLCIKKQTISSKRFRFEDR
jgi:hypothetical protein